MISPRQIRAARALLDWSQLELADRAIISLNALKRLESGRGDPRLSTVLAIKSALEAAGIEFVSGSGNREGVVLVLPPVT
jgi:predicted transcriptional regulator